MLKLGFYLVKTSEFFQRYHVPKLFNIIVCTKFLLATIMFWMVITLLCILFSIVCRHLQSSYSVPQSYTQFEGFSSATLPRSVGVTLKVSSFRVQTTELRCFVSNQNSNRWQETYLKSFKQIEYCEFFYFCPIRLLL